MRWAARVLAAYPVAIVILVLLTTIAPQQRGPLALVPILAPHLLLSTFLLVPLAAVARERVLVAALALSLLVVVAGFGDEWLSFSPVADAAAQLDVISWNLQFGVVEPGPAVDVLAQQDAEVIALQELTHDAAAAIEGDPALRTRYPHRALAPRDTVLGLGILSAHPIEQQRLIEDPASLTVQLALPDGREVVLVNVHPLPGSIGTLSFDGSRRDDRLQRLRHRIDSLDVGDAHLVIIGDLNVASSEASYRAFAAGLLDVHREVGVGPGWTWRPNRFANLGIGLLRLDYVLAGPSVVALASGLDCGLPGDHCMVFASVGIP